MKTTNEIWFEKEVSQLPEKVAVEVMKCFKIVEEYNLQKLFFDKMYSFYQTQKAQNPAMKFMLAYDITLDHFHL
jgi:hypothetical protein